MIHGSSPLNSTLTALRQGLRIFLNLHLWIAFEQSMKDALFMVVLGVTRIEFDA